MFDLFRRRDKAVRYLLTVLLGLVAISMVITLIPGYGTPSATSDNLIAEIGGEPLTVTEVQQTLNAAVRNRQLPPEMMQLYIPQMIDQMIRERAVAYQAKQLGFEVTDQELARAIRGVLSSYMPVNAFDRVAYQRFLADQNMTIEQFESNMRKNLLMLRLQNIALEGSIVVPEEIKREFHRRNDQVKIQYVAFSPTAARDSVTVTREEAQDYFNKNRSAYSTQERRTFDLLLADETRMAAQVDVSEQALRSAYQANLERYRSPERVRARHILIKTMEKPAGEVAALEAKARDILSQLRGGADFAELAKKHSEDTGSAIKGGDLDWVTRGQTVKEFEQTAFSLQPKQISDIVKTQYGFHIIQVLEKEQARVRPFEEVKNELASELKRREVFERMQNSIEQARAELVRDPKSAQQVAQKYGLSYAHAERVAAGESIPEIGTNREMEAAVQSARAGEVTPVVQLSPNQLGVAAVLNVEPPKPAEFADIADQVMAQLRAMKGNQVAQQKREEAAAKMRNAGGDLAAIAKELGAELKTTDFVTAQGNIEGVGPASAFADLFAKPVGAVAGPVTAGDVVVVAKTLDKRPADESKLAAERDAILGELKRNKALERKELFEDGLVAQLTKEGKIKKYPDAIKRLSSFFRG